jgi:hypothetical protein
MGRNAMAIEPGLSRRQFLVSSAVVGGLSLGFTLIGAKIAEE